MSDTFRETEYNPGENRGWPFRLPSHWPPIDNDEDRLEEDPYQYAITWIFLRRRYLLPGAFEECHKVAHELMNGKKDCMRELKTRKKFFDNLKQYIVREGPEEQDVAALELRCDVDHMQLQIGVYSAYSTFLEEWIKKLPSITTSNPNVPQTFSFIDLDTFASWKEFDASHPDDWPTKVYHRIPFEEVKDSLISTTNKIYEQVTKEIKGIRELKGRLERYVFREERKFATARTILVHQHLQDVADLLMGFSGEERRQYEELRTRFCNTFPDSRFDNPRHWFRPAPR
jgi:hypothetical protein